MLNDRGRHKKTTGSYGNSPHVCVSVKKIPILLTISSWAVQWRMSMGIGKTPSPRPSFSENSHKSQCNIDLIKKWHSQERLDAPSICKCNANVNVNVNVNGNVNVNVNVEETSSHYINIV